MSAVPTYVLFDDGRLHRDPVIRGRDWFVVFDESESTEFVMVGEATVADAERRLKRLGIEARITSGPWTGTRAFVRNNEVSYDPSSTFEIEVLEPLPLRLLTLIRPEDSPRGEHVVFAFGRGALLAGVL